MAAISGLWQPPITSQLAAAGIPGSAGGGDTSSLNLAELPAAVQHTVRAAYGDATGHIFLISAAIALVGVIAAAFLKPTTLRTTVDLTTAADGTTSAEATVAAVRNGDRPEHAVREHAVAAHAAAGTAPASHAAHRAGHARAE